MLSTILALCLPAGSTKAQSVHNWPTVNGSVTITTGNTFQTVLAAVPTGGVARRSLTIQNNNSNSSCQSANTCDLCWVFIGAGAATTGKAIELAATQAYTRYYPYTPSDAIQATCANNSDTLYVDTQ
jgi:hypothetical protein